ncbi:MAG: tetratricopeptide repeat protein [Pseudomonadota bacterium]
MLPKGGDFPAIRSIVALMAMMSQRFKSVVAAAVAVLIISAPARAQEEDLGDLFDALRQADVEAARVIEGRILDEWSKTGSPSLDLLMRRGREALEERDSAQAIEHLTALIDHAPDLAHAYSLRANAYFLESMYGPAIDDLRATLTRNPQHFEALTGLAAILEELGFLEEALEISRRVADITPSRDGLAAAIDRLEREVEGAAL